MVLEHSYNVSDVRKAAAAALPRPIFDYIDGGADDEITQRRNSCHRPAYRSQDVIGILEPADDRRNEARA